MADERKIYKVVIETTCYVLADDAKRAETWAEANLGGLIYDEPHHVSRTVEATLDNVAPESRGSLPWAAGWLADEEDGLTVEQWLARQI